MFAEGGEVGKKCSVGEEDEEGAWAGELGDVGESFEKRSPEGVGHCTPSKQAGIDWPLIRPVEQRVEADGRIGSGAGEDEEAEARGVTKAISGDDVLLRGRYRGDGEKGV